MAKSDTAADFLLLFIKPFRHLLQTVLNLQPPLEYTKEVNDYKSLIRTLVMGMHFDIQYSHHLKFLSDDMHLVATHLNYQFSY